MNANRPRGAMAMPVFAPLFSPGTESVTVRWLTVAYPTTEDIAAVVLPRPLSPAASPEVLIWVAEFIGASFTAGDGTVETRPAYMQAGINLRCRHGDTEGAYAIGTYVEGLNHGILGRELFGLPKKQSRNVHLHDHGRHLDFAVSNAAGATLISGTVDHAATPPADERTAAIVPDWFTTQFTAKIIPSADGAGFDISRLVRIPFAFTVTGPLRQGEASLEFTESGSDPLHILAVKGSVRTTYGHARLDIDYGTYLDHLDPADLPTFGAPHW
ncbi:MULTISPECIES: acetoacetate decarboxylase family protein [Rhodococcus]|nr:MULTISPECIES: acetoacetate decarboxylase family protein [Rhodococcus]